MKGIVLDDCGLLLSDSDNVATAVEDLAGGSIVSVEGANAPGLTATSITLGASIPFGHKFALVTIEVGDSVCKYGERIGLATERIEPGDWVHTHNCESNRGRGDRAAATDGGCMPREATR